MKQYIEKVLEMRRMDRSKILSYFFSLGENSMDNRKFVGRGREVELCDEKIITLGIIKIPTTIVIFRGTQDTVEQAIWAFRLRFLSAGDKISSCIGGTKYRIYIDLNYEWKYIL